MIFGLKLIPRPLDLPQNFVFLLFPLLEKS